MANEPRTVVLGNPNAIEIVEDPESGERTRRPIPEGEHTRVNLPEEWTLMQSAHEITAGNSMWNAHSDAPAPTWVASNDEQLAQILASHWGCDIRAIEEV